MKTVILTTGTNNTVPLIEPFKALGESCTIAYDDMTIVEQLKLPSMVAAEKPELIVYIGALEAHHGKPVPRAPILAEIGEIADMVHICCDGAEPVWWPQLVDYYENARFKLQVNIDGVRTGPIGNRGMTTIFPMKSEGLKPQPWGKRIYPCGFSGGLHFGRPGIIEPLIKSGRLKYRQRDVQNGHDPRSYESYLRFLGLTKVALNVAYTGGGTGSMHVKARTLEAAAMGCLVLENKKSPLGAWFTEEEDFLSYGDADDLEQKLDWVARNDGRAAEIAASLQLKVMTRHTPEIFVSQILERLGRGAALYPLKEAKYQYWELSGPIVVTYQPRLVEVIGGINIVSFEDTIMAVPQMLGSIDLAVEENRKNPMIRHYTSFDEAKAAVLAS